MMNVENNDGLSNGEQQYEQTHPEYHGLTRCPFCGKEKEASWLTCSRPSCEQEMYERGL